jgi:hypothetical protein
MNDNITEPHRLIEVFDSGSWFQVASPRHENGFAGRPNHFVAIGRMKQVHAIAIGQSGR